MVFILKCLLFWDEHGTLRRVRSKEKSVSILQLVQLGFELFFPCIGFLHHIDHRLLVIDESIDLHITHLLDLLTLTQSNWNIADLLADLLSQFIVLEEIYDHLVFLGIILARLVFKTAGSLLMRVQSI